MGSPFSFLFVFITILCLSNGQKYSGDDEPKNAKDGQGRSFALIGSLIDAEIFGKKYPHYPGYPDYSGYGGGYGGGYGHYGTYPGYGDHHHNSFGYPTNNNYRPYPFAPNYPVPNLASPIDFGGFGYNNYPYPSNPYRNAGNSNIFGLASRSAKEEDQKS